MTDADIGEGHSSEEDIMDNYDEFTRTGTQPERAPINVYYVSTFNPATIMRTQGKQTNLLCRTLSQGTQLARMTNEASEALRIPEGLEGSFQRLRDFAEVTFTILN